MRGALKELATIFEGPLETDIDYTEIPEFSEKGKADASATQL